MANLIKTTTLVAPEKQIMVADELTFSIGAVIGNTGVDADANGKKMTVTAASGLTPVSQIAAADSPDGNAITVNGAKFTPATAGFYAFEFISRDKATGTYVSGTTYYNQAIDGSAIDTTGFEAGVTDVSSYYIGDPKKHYKIIKIVN